MSSRLSQAAALETPGLPVGRGRRGVRRNHGRQDALVPAPGNH